MSSKGEIAFYASRNDLLKVLSDVELAGALQYVRTGNTPDEAQVRFFVASEIPELGIADADSSVACTKYLVADRATRIHIRRIATIEGTLYAIDQLINPDTVTLTPAGMRNDAIMLHGRVATASPAPAALALMKRFSRAFGKGFTRVKTFSVGSEARARMADGVRMTMSVHSPQEYDLSIS